MMPLLPRHAADADAACRDAAASDTGRHDAF